MRHPLRGPISERYHGGQLLAQIHIVSAVHHLEGAPDPAAVQSERLGQQHQLLAVVTQNAVELLALRPHKRQVVAHICEVHKPRLKAGKSPRLIKHKLNVQVRFLVHPGDGLPQRLHRLGRERLVGVAAHGMARLNRLHRRELSGGKGKERTGIRLQSGHGSPFSEVAAPSIAQER